MRVEVGGDGATFDSDAATVGGAAADAFEVVTGSGLGPNVVAIGTGDPLDRAAGQSLLLSLKLANGTEAEGTLPCIADAIFTDTENPLAFISTDIAKFTHSFQRKLPRCGVVMPVKGVHNQSYANWRTQITFQLIKLLFALTAVPFFIFTIGPFSKIFAHTDPTAWTRTGRCVRPDPNGLSAYLDWLKRDVLQNKTCAEELEALAEFGPGPLAARLMEAVDEHERRQGKGMYMGFATAPLTKGGTAIDPGRLPPFPTILAARHEMSENYVRESSHARG